MAINKAKRMKSFSRYLNNAIDQRLAQLQELPSIQDGMATVRPKMTQSGGEWAGWNEGWPR